MNPGGLAAPLANPGNGDPSIPPMIFPAASPLTLNSANPSSYQTKKALQIKFLLATLQWLSFSFYFIPINNGQGSFKPEGLKREAWRLNIFVSEI